MQKSEISPKRIKSNVLIGHFLKKIQERLLRHWNTHNQILFMLSSFLAYSNGIFNF